MTFSLLSKAQNVVNEYSNFECSQSKLISVPFPETKNSLPNKAPVSLTKTVFYEHRDQFSYWYKVVMNEDKLIDCKISAINKGDSYVLYVYKYDKEDFCNKVFYGKIKPMKASSFINNTEFKEAFELSEVQLKAKKDEAYYFCVLNISPSNCGHTMRLTAGNDTLTVKAVHFPCTDEDTDTKPPVAQNQPVLTETDGELSQKHIFETILMSVKEENNKMQKIDARVKIKDELTGLSLIMKPTGEGSYKLQIERGKSYNVECFSTGYKKFDHSIVISEYVNPDSNTFDVFLKQLKKGDLFVMDNIYFYPNTYALKKGSEKEITYLLNYMSNNQDVKIELQGNTNGNNRINKNKAYKAKGPEWNFKGSSKKLSMYRAEAIKNYLISKGIESRRISTKGFGGDNMLIENPKTLNDIQKNVRVEVLVL